MHPPGKLSFTLILFIAFSGVDIVHAQSRPQPAPAASQLPKLYTAIRQEKYIDAQKLCEQILRAGSPADRQQASLTYGRVLLSLGKLKEATEYVANMQKLKLPKEEDQQLLRVYDAWLRGQQGKHDEAIKSLQGILKRGAPHASTAEAADVLAVIHLQKKETKQAEASARFGLQLLSYHELKTPYIEDLLKLRLKQGSTGAAPENGEAVALYKKAEELRTAEKFIEAGKVYMDLRKRFPKASQSDTAGFRIGQCLLGLGNPAEAKKHWQTFLQAAPNGPWRGQTHLGLIDLTLQSDLDLTAALKQARLAASALTGKLPAPSQASWNQAATNIHIQAGLLAYAARKTIVATDAFARARDSATKSKQTSLAAQLSALVGAAREAKPLLPAEFQTGGTKGKSNSKPKANAKATPQQQLNGLLSVALLDNRFGRYERAAGVLKAVVSRPNLLRTKMQQAFVLSQQARALHGLEEYPKARSGYLAALNSYRVGSWHDETLYQLAILIERMGELEPSSSTTKKAAAPKPQPVPLLKNPNIKPPAVQPRQPTRRLTAAEQQAQAKRERLSKARRMALTYWKQLLDRFPESDYTEAALYHAADINYDQLADPAGKSSGGLTGWTNVAGILTTLIQKYPDSGWVGNARVKLIDIHLERLFQLPIAEQHAVAAIAWLEEQQADKANNQSPPVTPGGNLAHNRADPLNVVTTTAGKHDPQKQTTYDIYVRSGLVAYLQQNSPQAAALFEKAKPFQPPRNFVVVHGTVPTGIERLITAAKSGQSLTPQSVLEGDETARLILMLADVYHAGQQFERSLELCNRVVKGTAPQATKTQRSYALFKRGRNYYGRDSDSPDDRRQNAGLAGKDYLAAQKTDPKSDWADNCYFLAANIHWNHNRDTDRAVFLYKRLLDVYPESEEADRSAYFIGICYEWGKRFREAKAAYEYSQKHFPASRFGNLVEKHLKEVESTLKTSKTISSKNK